MTYLDPTWTPVAGYSHAAGLLAILERSTMRTTVRLSPGEVRRELDVWLARSPKSECDRYLSGQRAIRFSDGRLARTTPSPGCLYIDGKVEYSSAWL